MFIVNPDFRRKAEAFGKGNKDLGGGWNDIERNLQGLDGIFP
jgi:hypothetical protein